MAQSKKETWDRLNALLNDPSVRVLDTIGQKYAIISDVHLGDGGNADDLRENKETLVHVLQQYRTDGFKLILLGDIEELWQFDIEQVVDEYENNVYKAIKSFGDERVFRVFGNHDSQWKTPPDPIYNNVQNMNGAAEALKMKDGNGDVRILLVHGHQGNTECDKYSWFSKYFVRLYKHIEPLIKVDPHTSSTKSQIAKDYEQIFYGWAKKNQRIVICGHSHRAIFASRSRYEKIEDDIARLQQEIYLTDRTNVRASERRMNDNIKNIMKLKKELLDEQNKEREIEPVETDLTPLPCYFNTGCCLFTDGITALEIANDQIKLVKWSKKDLTQKPKDYGTGNLGDFVATLTAA